MSAAGAVAGWLEMWVRPARSRLRRRPDAPTPGSINPRTGKAAPGRHYAARTINNQVSVLFGFYDHACAADLGPLVDPAGNLRAAGLRPDLTAQHRPH